MQWDKAPNGIAWQRADLGSLAFRRHGDVGPYQHLNGSAGLLRQASDQLRLRAT